MTAIPENLGYLAARAHARRSQIAEAQRLDALCRLRSVEELGRAVRRGGEGAGVPGFQRGLALGWVQELEELAGGLGPRRARLLDALVERLRVEDLKVLVRGLATHLSPGARQARLLRPLADRALASASSLEELATLLRAPSPEPLLLEAFLDRGYFTSLLAAVEGLPPRDRERVRALAAQEVDHFHLMLVVRGRFLRGLAPEALLPWHVEGAGISRALLTAALAERDLSRAVGRTSGIALDGLPRASPLEPGALEARAWSRYQRLAERTFRGGAMDFAVLVGYAALRRVEVANLVTLSEGIRLGVPADALRARMVPAADPEVALA